MFCLIFNAHLTLSFLPIAMPNQKVLNCFILFLYIAELTKYFSEIVAAISNLQNGYQQIVDMKTKKDAKRLYDIILL